MANEYFTKMNKARKENAESLLTMVKLMLNQKLKLE